LIGTVLPAAKEINAEFKVIDSTLFLLFSRLSLSLFFSSEKLSAPLFLDDLYKVVGGCHNLSPGRSLRPP
jgi:hypothetical protein